ncbi:hypothetical protein MES4922_30426 [Mesorhizobium ventifaucium]|uniref:Response regulator n=1 Tax=Mesorhizobium ventifaucium TaxID=666020 RepID=A0ABM9DZ28_9HYPH|nr:hypothetical protein MES4922_30426 [Mesorhizobium ventifaucium]
MGCVAYLQKPFPAALLIGDPGGARVVLRQLKLKLVSRPFGRSHFGLQ